VGKPRGGKAEKAAGSYVGTVGMIRPTLRSTRLQTDGSVIVDTGRPHLSRGQRTMSCPCCPL
jgi:hypothetical protein